MSRCVKSIQWLATYNVECLRSPLANKGSCDSRNALGGRDMALGVVLEEIRDRHFGLDFWKAMSGSGKI